jgi:hypothetical protein
MRLLIGGAIVMTAAAACLTALFLYALNAPTQATVTGWRTTVIFAEDGYAAPAGAEVRPVSPRG